MDLRGHLRCHGNDNIVFKISVLLHLNPRSYFVWLMYKLSFKKELYTDYNSEFEGFNRIGGHKAISMTSFDHVIRARKLLTKASYHTLK